MRVEHPPEPLYFVNRDDERERAVRATADWQSRSRPLVLALSGPGGLGKTELAVLIARTLGPYTDGVLSVDLDDFRADGVLDPGDVLSQLLNSLDVAPDQVQAQYAARCAQYWNRTSEAKLILLLDNARYAWRTARQGCSAFAPWPVQGESEPAATVDGGGDGWAGRTTPSRGVQSPGETPRGVRAWGMAVKPLSGGGTVTAGTLFPRVPATSVSEQVTASRSKLRYSM
ncbi:ATP-binding protein [Streptomyces fimicarius]|uniref:ATP-binding protein n=1 Tax=Streptomyces griseus TaxID=1911 RepID=UPI0036B1417B